LQATRPDLAEMLKESGRAATGTRGRARAALLVSEIAIAMLLLVGAGLMLRSFSRLSHVDPGFDPHDVLTGGMALPDSQYKDDAAIRAFYRQLLPRLASLPGAEGGAVGMPLPFTRSNIGLKFDIDGRPDPGPHSPNIAAMRFVSPGYFKVMGVR